jgi:hypothetical protein
MKKEQLQKILKPLIKECIKEMIFEEGILSNLIKEVAVGIGSQQTIVEARVSEPEHDFSRQRVELQEEAQRAMADKKRKLEESLGGSFKGIFDNVDPIKPSGPTGKNSSNSPLSSYTPDDAGVDISGIMALGGGKNWKNMI